MSGIQLLPSDRFRKAIQLSLLTVAAMSLVACNATWRVRAGCESSGGGANCKVEGEVSGKWIVERSASTDFSNLSIDVSGSTIAFPSYGQLNISLVAEDAGTTLASGTFAWVRSGSRISLVDPAAANAWALPYAEVATRVNFALDDFSTAEASGQNTITASVDVNGVSQASASQVWNGGCQYFCDEK